jgi:hypothetical protein
MLNGVGARAPRSVNRVSESARVVLGLIRLANGTGALLAPEPFARRLGVDPEANPAASYITRLFGVRTMVIGYELLQRNPEVRQRALRAALFVHATDTAAAVVAGATDRIPRKTAVTAGTISATNTLLALIARRGSG